MSFELSFSPEFYSSEDEHSSEQPFTVYQAICAMSSARYAEMALEVFGCDDPNHVSPDAVMDKIMETNTCGTLSSPVPVYIDPEGYFTVDVYDTPRHIPIPGQPGVPLCGNELQGETVAWLDRNHLANCPKCQELEPDA